MNTAQLSSVIEAAWDARDGISPTTKGESRDAVETALSQCWSCHGKETAPKDASIPLIQGQSAAYLEKQLKDFRAGTRDSQIMSSMAEAVRRDDIPKASAILAAMQWPKISGAEALPAPDAAAACAACHGAGLLGAQSPEGPAPRLAGQFAEYLDEQMGAFARGERANAKTMTAMMKALSAAERLALAKYLAGI